jgi:hypothetical protein
MRHVILYLSLFSAAMAPALPRANGTQPTLPVDALERVRAFFEVRVGVRYMEGDCRPVSYPGWESFPVQECTYGVKGRRDTARKTAKVVMLNPSSDQLARWVVATCVEVTGRARLRCTGALGRHIIGQSGAQFPVAGIVFEDIIPADGVFEVYAFRDGVTVRVRGVNHRGTAQPTAEEIEKSLSGFVLSTGRYARIQGTTREQYRANGGSKDVNGLAWLGVSRELYQAAWGQERNELMIAWARANAVSLK